MQNMAAHVEAGLQFPDHLAVDTVRAALLEDLGLAGDITTNAIISPEATSEAVLALREDGCIAGMPLVATAFRALDPEIVIEPHVKEGYVASAGSIAARITGNTRAYLTAERVALNHLQ
ncbi:MAG: nicotinate-nucleotide diphosphorylase (carboxylating), partial [Rhodomicrobium sp.]